MNLTAATIAHLAEITLAAGERIKAIRNHGADSIESTLSSINYSRACIACNRSGLTAEEWEVTMPIRRAFEKTFAEECKRSYALARAEEKAG